MSSHNRSFWEERNEKEETDLRLPLGQMVEVDGHNMSIYVEGTGDTTLVFMSGGVLVLLYWISSLSILFSVINTRL